MAHLQYHDLISSLFRTLTEASDTAPRWLASVVGMTKELKRTSVALYYRDQANKQNISKPNCHECQLTVHYTQGEISKVTFELHFTTDYTLKSYL